jgi:hypothetical protein
LPPGFPFSGLGRFDGKCTIGSGGSGRDLGFFLDRWRATKTIVSS